MYSENFKADFLKMASATHKKITTFQTFRCKIHILGVEMWFKYQNNKQNLQIWDMHILPNFKLRLISWEWVTSQLFLFRASLVKPFVLIMFLANNFVVVESYS